MRLTLWGGTTEKHTQEINTYFATPQRGVTFVVESTGGALCGPGSRGLVEPHGFCSGEVPARVRAYTPL